jgi:hypothetical protein
MLGRTYLFCEMKKYFEPVPDADKDILHSNIFMGTEVIFTSSPKDRNGMASQVYCAVCSSEFVEPSHTAYAT